MGTNIQTGKIPVNISSNSSYKNSKVAGQDPASTQAGVQQSKSTDTVSMTDKVSRLQEIENQLATASPVNDARVAEIKQAIQDGSFKIDSESIASKLIEMETGVLDSDNNSDNG